MGKPILLIVRYLLGGIFFINALAFSITDKAYFAAMANFLLAAGILIPVNIKIFGRVNILATHFSFKQLINLYWPIYAAFRWFVGVFSGILCTNALISKNNPFLIGNLFLALIFSSPLDRFFFPPLHTLDSPDLKKRRSAILTLRTIAVGLQLFACQLSGSSTFDYILLILAFVLLATAVLITPRTMIIYFTEPEHKNNHTIKGIYADAYVARWKITPTTTEAEFNALIKEFQKNLIDSNNYKHQIANHRNPGELKKQALDELTLYASTILKRPEMVIEKYPGYQSHPVTVAQQIEAIWKADKKLRSLYNATKKYASQRGAKSFWEIAAHVAEFRATINLYKMIARSQKKEEETANEATPDLSLTLEEISLLSDDTYFKIIDHIILLGKDMERYKTFNDNFNEERYRDYFLPFLNAVSPNYSAKGEVFNHKGKTDILVFDTQGNNIFIAECKIWRGEVYLLQAVDQLLQRYIHWRDEKTAIIIFNRDIKNFSQIIAVATNALSQHTLCHQAGVKRSDTSWSYWFRHPDDNNRLVQLELVLFNFA